MAVTYLSGSGALSSSDTSVTANFTVTAGANFAIWGTDATNNSPTVSSGTYNGSALTAVGAAPQRAKLWSLVNPATGTNVLSFTLTGFGQLVFAGASLSGVDTVTPLGTVVQTTGTSTTPATPSITVPAGGLAFAIASHYYTGSGTITATSPSTLIHSYRNAGSGYSFGAAYRSTTGTIAFTMPGSAAWEAIGVPINSATADSTPPTLTSPSVSSITHNTATGSVTTNEGNGTAYAVVTTSATAPTATQVRAGQDNAGATAAWSGNQAVSATGTLNFNASGLSGSTTYYFHFHHRDSSNNDSSVVSSTSFTTSVTPVAPAFTTQPSNQSVVVGGTATFNVVVTGTPTPTLQWQRSTNSGGSWSDLSGSTSSSYTTPATTLTGGSANNNDQYRVVATNSAGTVNSNAATLTVNTAPGVITTPIMRKNDGTLLANETGVVANVYNPTTGALVVRVTGLTSNSSGIVTISSSSISPGTSYAYEIVLTSNGRRLPSATAT